MKMDECKKTATQHALLKKATTLNTFWQQINQLIINICDPYLGTTQFDGGRTLQGESAPGGIFQHSFFQPLGYSKNKTACDGLITFSYRWRRFEIFVIPLAVKKLQLTILPHDKTFAICLYLLKCYTLHKIYVLEHKHRLCVDMISLAFLDWQKRSGLKNVKQPQGALFANSYTD